MEHSRDGEATLIINLDRLKEVVGIDHHHHKFLDVGVMWQCLINLQLELNVMVHYGHGGMETMAKQDYGVLRVVNYVCIQDAHIQTNLTVVCCKLELKLIG